MIATKNILLEYYDEIECIALTRYNCNVALAAARLKEIYNLKINPGDIEDFRRIYLNNKTNLAVESITNISEFIFHVRDILYNTKDTFNEAAWYDYYREFITLNNIKISHRKLNIFINKFIKLNVLKTLH